MASAQPSSALEESPTPVAGSDTKAASGTLVGDEFIKDWQKRREAWLKREIPVGAEGVPQRFINAEKGDVAKAKARYEKTAAWRKENKVDDVLMSPHPDFNHLKKCICMYYHGRGKDGRVVYWEKPKESKIKTLQQEKMSIQRVLKHYTHSSEYCFQILDIREIEGKSINVMDVAGIGLADVIGDVRSFMQAILGQSQEHYPERSQCTLIINAHWTFSGIWNLVKGWMDPVTVAKTKIVTKEETLKTLLMYIDADQIPKAYGGKCECVDPTNPQNKSCRFFSKEERQLREIVSFFNAKAEEEKKSSKEQK
eukprot:g63723.t1